MQIILVVRAVYIKLLILIWLSHYFTSRKVAGLIPNEITGFSSC
jgi:hypothetical protein